MNDWLMLNNQEREDLLIELGFEFEEALWYAQQDDFYNLPEEVRLSIGNYFVESGAR